MYFYIQSPYLVHVDHIFPRAIFAVVMPLEDGNGGPLSFEIPVVYDIDSGE